MIRLPTVMGLVGAGTVAGIVVAAAAFGSFDDQHTQHRSTFAVSARSTPVTSAQRVGRDASGAPTGNVVGLLGKRGGRAFYRAGAPGENCYSVGPAASVGTMTATICWSRTLPLMDFSVVDISPTTGVVRLYRAEGIAADQVATVSLTDNAGTVFARATVTNNIFAFENLPDRPVGRMIALDAQGRTLYSKPLR